MSIRQPFPRTPLVLVFCLLAIVAPGVFAAIDAYEFDEPAKEQRFYNLIEELRCPKCQNQNIADSNAPLSKDLRQKVADMIREGHEDGEITDYLVQRYGDFITYRPPLNAGTLALWLGPFVILIAIALLLRYWISNRSRAAPAAELSTQERERLQTVLDNYGENNKS